MITFTLAQVNELLQALGKVPYEYSAPLIAGIKQIAETQLKEQSKEMAKEDDQP
ncbi:hypothetical protein UFOVP192_56 [uncultured Caudovirales phage]|uniref:Uncharacterized protein n=1 Tax=uncultured Caudovirales phage TaxID=2100421 RepID=A0A6J7WFA8_9CAUD|nr:hypothetical protein UFOVP192_56 [uncultured Caudovirales phage]